MRTLLLALAILAAASLPPGAQAGPPDALDPVLRHVPPVTPPGPGDDGGAERICIRTYPPFVFLQCDD